MRIAICENETAQRTLLERLVEAWATVRKVPMKVRCFPSSEAFLFAWEDDKDVDLLILDIKMADMDGMELARKLRGEKAEVQILFVTGYDMFMQEGYEVEALHYLLKPVQEEKLFAVLDKALANSVLEAREMFRTRDGMLALTPSEIWYIEAQRHDCNLATAEHTYVIREGITEMGKRFEKHPAFVFCHRSICVNLQHVASLGPHDLTLDDGRKLPVSRGMASKVLQAFLEFYAHKEVETYS